MIVTPTWFMITCHLVHIAYEIELLIQQQWELAVLQMQLYNYDALNSTAVNLPQPSNRKNSLLFKNP